MSTTSSIEERLAAALAARAEQVRPEDLRHVEPPRPSRWWLPRSATYALAAAACVAAVAAPFVFGGGPGERREDTPVAPSPTPNGDAVPGADWREAYSYPRGYDLDGDGRADRVVVRTEVDEELPPGRRRVEAHLSTGGVAAVVLDYETYDLTGVEAVQLDADADPGEEVLYYRGTETEEIGVLDLVDGALVDLVVPADPGLTSQPDRRYRARGWFVEDGSLLTYRTVEEGFVPGAANATPPPYEVDVWRWSLEDGALTPEPTAGGCWDGGQRVTAC